MHHTSLSNNSNNNNNSTLQISENGFHCLINGMKLTRPRWYGPGNFVPQVPPSPMTMRVSQSHLKTYSYQAASNAAAESAHYCDSFLQTSYRAPSAVHNKRYQAGGHPTQRSHQSKKSGQATIAKYSLSPYVHQSTKRPGRDIKMRQLQIQQEYLQSSARQLDNTPACLSTDDHYEHYYSYYYSSDRKHRTESYTNRKLLSKFMASARHNVLPIDGALNHNPPTRKPTDNNPVPQQQHILKEKIANNNVIQQFVKKEWMAGMNDEEIMSVADDFIDVGDVDTYGNSLKMSNANDIQFVDEHFSTRSVRTRSEARDFPDFCYTPTNPWTDCALKNNCHLKDHNYDNELHSHHTPQEKPRLKLPNHEEQIQRHTKTASTHKPAATGKKLSPPTHRVLLYSSQSPRFQRTMPATIRASEIRRSRNKTPSPIAGSKHGHCINGGNPGNSKVIACNISILKSLRPREEGGDNRVTETKMAQFRAPNIETTTSILPKALASASDGNDDHDDDDDDLDDLDNGSLSAKSCDSSSSESEDAYRENAYKLTHSMDNVFCTNSPLTSQTSDESLQNPGSLLVASLFPNVPPYLAFSSNSQKGPDVPPELYRILKWRVSTVMPKVVRLVLANSGMRLLKKTNDWMGTWGKHMKSPCFKTIRPYQKINHLPGSFKIGRKDACWKNLQRQMNKHGKKDFGFMPKTYIIPRDIPSLRKNWPKYSERNVKWIIKPPASARGAGIRVVNRWAQIPKRKPLIVQKYIERPLLINGSKFDLRLYVLVTSINPLRVFMYHNGLARFASVKYSDKTDTLNDRCMHLTNYSINKLSSNYAKNEDVNACHGHKWTIKSLWTYLSNRGIRTDCLWEAMQNLVLRTLLAGENSINNMIKVNVESRYSCFELFGFDVLLDADLIPWLLEVNISPSLHSELPLDAHVKAPLVQGVLNTALFNVPPKLALDRQKELAAVMSLPPGPICYDKRLYINYLSSAEKVKHTTFTRKTMETRDEYLCPILDNLTPDDVRCLIVAEDELARCAPLERIFPTNNTHKYLKYTETPRYYNRLLDAWETRYAYNRTEGIELLREYCEDKYHLEIPQPPAKKDSNNNDNTPNEAEQISEDGQQMENPNNSKPDAELQTAEHDEDRDQINRGEYTSFEKDIRECRA